jgi:hypothetical protein
MSSVQHSKVDSRGNDVNRTTQVFSGKSVNYFWAVLKDA